MMQTIILCLKLITYQEYSYGEWFKPRSISYLFGVIVRVKVLFRKTVLGD